MTLSVQRSGREIRRAERFVVRRTRQWKDQRCACGAGAERYESQHRIEEAVTVDVGKIHGDQSQARLTVATVTAYAIRQRIQLAVEQSVAQCTFGLRQIRRMVTGRQRKGKYGMIP